MAENVAGSCGCTPTSIDDITRVNPIAAAAPTTIPAALSRKPCPTTRPNTRPGAAPSAMRSPISAVRCRTESDSTPYNPTDASTAAIRLKQRGAPQVERMGPEKAQSETLRAQTIASRDGSREGSGWTSTALTH
jgi:hypothetical protein